MPPNSASAVKSLAVWLPIQRHDHIRNAPSTLSTASISGAAQVNMDWNSRYMMKKKAIPPVTECRKMPSSRVWFLINTSPLAPKRCASWCAVARNCSSDADVCCWPSASAALARGDRRRFECAQPLPRAPSPNGRKRASTQRLERRAQCLDIQAQLVGIQHVDHVGQHRDLLAVARAFANHLEREIKALFQARGVDHTQHLTDVRVEQRPLEVLDRNLFICGDRLQRVGAGEIDQFHPRYRLQAAPADIDGNTRKIGDLVVQSGQPVEQQAFPELGLPISRTLLIGRSYPHQNVAGDFIVQ